MKKEYTAPTTIICSIAHGALLGTVSGAVVKSEDIGMGYGGVDEDGKKDPTSRRRVHRRSVWDDGDADEMY